MRQDVSDLLHVAVVSDAIARVHGKLDTALASLDETSQSFILSYFEGESLAALAQRHGLTEQQARDWLSRIKRELNHALKARVAVKQ